MTRVLIRHFFTNILPCKGSLQCTCRCSPLPKKTSFNWTRPYVRGGLRKMPTEMIRHIFTLMIWLKAPGSLSWRVQYVAARRWPGLYNYQMVAKRIHYKQTKDHFANGVFVRECEILIENHCGIFTLYFLHLAIWSLARLCLFIQEKDYFQMF